MRWRRKGHDDDDQAGDGDGGDSNDDHDKVTTEFGNTTSPYFSRRRMKGRNLTNLGFFFMLLRLNIFSEYF